MTKKAKQSKRFRKNSKGNPHTGTSDKKYLSNVSDSIIYVFILVNY